MPEIPAAPAAQTLTLPPGPFAAYLFDLDGTIADSMPIHFRAWTRAVEEAGGTFPEDLFYDWGGLPLPRTVELLNERFSYTMSPDAVVQRKEELYFSMLPEIRPVAGTLEHIHRSHGTIPFAIVSGSPRASIRQTLTTLHLLDLFPIIVGAEDYTHGKPDPEPFLNAAARLGVDPTQCLVFEDADLGIEAAEAAGMQWVRIPPPHTRAHLA